MIVALGLYTLLIALAGMIWGNTPRSFPAAFSIRGYDVGGTRCCSPPTTRSSCSSSSPSRSRWPLLFRATSLGLQMRAAAFEPEVARLLGVRVGRMFTLGWALAALAGALAGVLVAPSVFLAPNNFDPILISGFVAAVLGGLDSPPGAVLGGMLLGLALSYVVRLRGRRAGPAGGAGDARARADDPPRRACSRRPRSGGYDRWRRRPAPVRRLLAISTLLRSLCWSAFVGVAAVLLSDSSAPTTTSSWPTGAYYFAALAGLTVLIGLSGQISLGHGALMAVGAYTVVLLVGNEGWALVPALVAAVVVSAWSGSRSARRRAGCAGPTWQARRSPSPSACRRSPTASRATFGGRERPDDQSPDAAVVARRRASRSSAGRRGSPARARWSCCSCSTT